MRPGVIVSIIGHVGAVMMTMLAWEARTVLVPSGSTIVPIEIVDVAAEANVRALAEDVPDEEVSPEEDQEAAEQEPAPAPTPQPAQQRRQQANDDFNLADISGLIDRQRDPGRQRQEGQRADRNQRGAGLGTAERTSIEARVASIVQQQLNRCWRTVADLPDPERLRVTLSFRLNRDGSLNGQPRVVSPANYTFDPEMNEAVNRALRAVRTCDPIDRLPNDPVVGEYFDIWRDQEVTFGLRIQG
ncbi:MAG: cell envelope integrity protein TolA [Hyphomonadaceae bacterium]